MNQKVWPKLISILSQRYLAIFFTGVNLATFCAQTIKNGTTFKHQK
jgi:hypothetical protein